MALESIGAKIKLISQGAVEIDTRTIRNEEAPIELMRKLRASYYLAGALRVPCSADSEAQRLVYPAVAIWVYDRSTFM